MFYTCRACDAPQDNEATAAYKELALRPLVYGLCTYLFTKIPFKPEFSFLRFGSPTGVVVSAAVGAGAVEGLGGVGLARLPNARASRPPIWMRCIATLPAALIPLLIATYVVQRSLSWQILKETPMIGVGSVLTFPIVGASISVARHVWTNPKIALFEDDNEVVKECHRCKTLWDSNFLAGRKLFGAAIVSSVILPFVLCKAIPSVPGKVWMAGALFSPMAVYERARSTSNGERLEETRPLGAYLNLLGVTLSALSVYLMTRKWGPRLDLKGAAGIGLLGYVGARAIDWTITGAINNAFSIWPRLTKSYNGQIGEPPHNYPMYRS